MGHTDFEKLLLKDCLYFNIFANIDEVNGENWQNVLINPNTFVGLVGKVRKKLSPEGGRKGVEKKARAARPPDPGLEPGTCRVLGEGPQLHARGAV